MLSYIPHYYLPISLHPASRKDVLLAALSLVLLLTLLFATLRLLDSAARNRDPGPAKILPNASTRARKSVKSKRKGPVRPVQDERQARGLPAPTSAQARDTSLTSATSTATSTSTSATSSSSAQTSEQEQHSELEPERNGFFATLRAMIATTLPRAVQLPLPDLATLSLSSDRVNTVPTSAAPTPPPNAHAASQPVRILSETPLLNLPEVACPVKQPYDAFLVLDVEATCQEGTDFNYPNEIIEWPVCLLQWRNKDKQGRAKELYVADEFRSFVKPTWKPELSAFCTTLTGITQTDVNRAPRFAKVLDSFKEFMVRNGLIDSATGQKLLRYTWCTDGPFDIRDFVVKQCFISKIQMPEWLKGDVLDVRKTVNYYLAMQEAGSPTAAARQQQYIVFPRQPGMPMPKRRSLNISQQLHALSLPAFVGRQHSGIDDTRNIARIVTELGKRGIRLEPNTTIFPGRRWQWMGKPGQVLEEYCFN